MKTQTQNEATARPWTVQEGKTLLHIETANLGDGSPCGMPVCSIPKTRRPDADLIVRAVNEHAALVAVVEKLLAWHDDESGDTSLSEVLKLARAAVREGKAQS